MNKPLTLWTVYDHPVDYPDFCVARRHEVLADGTMVATDDAVFASTLDDVRAKLPPGLVRLERHVSDAPSIVETWL